jgi:uncharacterized protein YbjT (DUF2867 family)
MKVILFGASGMIGQAVLRECLADPRIDGVLSIARRLGGTQHAKLREIAHSDFSDFTALEHQWRGYDACFYCLGVSSAGMREDEYRRVTYGYTLAAARTLSELNPAMTFVYVSGAGTDSVGDGSSMWARVKGATENALISLPFKAVMFRPGGIVPMHGERSKTRSYRIMYALTRPFWGLLLKVLPNSMSTTEQIARAMIRVAREGADKPVMEVRDINAWGGR